MALGKKNLAVFISGRGSNLEVILKNKEKFASVFVVSSRSEALGLQRAQNHGVASMVLPSPIDWEGLQQDLEKHSIDLIFLAGFMKIVPPQFVEKWAGRLFNLHPSLLPKYKGLKAIDRAFKAQDDIGVTIHHVVPEVDAGEIVLQEIAVPKEDLAPLSLAEVVEKTHLKEHQLVQKWVDLHTR